MALLIRGFDRLLDLCGLIAGLTLALIAVLMCVDIFGRNLPALFGLIHSEKEVAAFSLPWVTELSEYLIYFTAFLGAPWALRAGAHIRVDVVVAYLPRQSARVLEKITDLIGITISGALVVYGGLAVREAWINVMYVRKTWDVPEWLLLSPILLSGTLLFFGFLIRFLRSDAVGSRIDETDSKSWL